MAKVFRQLTFNLGGPVIRQATLNGIEYTVVPVNMLAEGVWEGSGGKVLYPGEELEKSAPVWNHKPLVIYHPKSVDGKPISACEPNVLNTRCCGLILNTKYDRDSKKLKAEAYIDAKRADQIDRRVMKAVNSRTVIESSTGLWTENEEGGGEFDGKPYDVLARNYLADHLAILPDKVGAYPASAGGGMLQVNAASTDPESMQEAYINSFKRFLVTAGLQWTNNELSYSAIGRQLHDLISTKYGKPGKYFQGCIHEIFKNRVVFGMDDGEPGLYMLNYEVKDDTVQLKGSATKVKQVVKYQANNSEAYAGNESGDLILVTQEERMSFNKKDHLASLKAGGWGDAELIELEKLPDSILEGIRPKTDESPASKLVKNEQVKKKDEETETPATTPIKAQTWDDLVANSSPEVQSMLEDMKESQDEQRSSLVAEITTNAKLGGVKFKDGYLEKKSTKELRLMAALAKGHAKTGKKKTNEEEDFILPQGPASFVGNVGAEEDEITDNEGDEDEPIFSGPVAPKMFKINDESEGNEDETPAPKKNKKKAV